MNSQLSSSITASNSIVSMMLPSYPIQLLHQTQHLKGHGKAVDNSCGGILIRGSWPEILDGSWAEINGPIWLDIK